MKYHYVEYKSFFFKQVYTFLKNNICSAGYSSLCEHLPSIHKALISIPTT